MFFMIFCALHKQAVCISNTISLKASILSSNISSRITNNGSNHYYIDTGESCLTESPGRGFEVASPQILRGEGLPRFFPSPDPTHVGASGTGSALIIIT